MLLHVPAGGICSASDTLRLGPLPAEFQFLARRRVSGTCSWNSNQPAQSESGDPRSGCRDAKRLYGDFQVLWLEFLVGQHDLFSSRKRVVFEPRL